MEMAKTKKVLCPIERKSGVNGDEKKTFWTRVGTAYTNRDGSTNVYLDVTPLNGKLQIRDLDEQDLKPRSEHGASGAGAPF